MAFTEYFKLKDGFTESRKNGTDLKKELGLGSIKNVLVSKVCNTPLPLYMISYDSLYDRPLNRHSIEGESGVASVRMQPYIAESLEMVLHQDIEDFNNITKNDIYFLVDLAGSRFASR